MTVAIAVLAALILLPLVFLLVDLGRGAERDAVRAEPGSASVAGRRTGDPETLAKHEEDLHYRRAAQARQ